MFHAMLHTLHEDAFAFALVAFMIAVILWLPFIGILALIVHGMTG
jgi:hypothetical protein